MTSKGFTLIELMIVVVVIGVLATVGAVSYRSATSAGREARERADIDAIAKAYELSYNPETALYRRLTDADFSNGKKPDNPKITYVQGPEATVVDATAYKVCMPLDASTSCDTESDLCYCRSSSQAFITQSGPTLTPVPTRVALATSTPVPAATSTPTPIPTATPTPNQFPTSGLVAYWKMDEVSGNTVSDSIGTNHGNASGTAIVWGKLGRARRFTGNGEIIQTAARNYSLNAMTSCAWTYVESTAPLWNVLIGQWNSGAGVWNFSFNTAYQLHYHPNGYGSVNGPNVPSLNNWVHLCVTRATNGSVFFYRNGGQSSTYTTAQGALSTASVPVTIGSFNWDFNQSYRGYIDEVGIWNRTLSAAEIQQIYNNGNGRQP